MSLTITLERDRIPVMSMPFANAGAASLSGNTATLCVSGTYQGIATTTVTAPAFGWPPSRTWMKKSTLVPISC